jgi:hypothetical protein
MNFTIFDIYFINIFLVLDDFVSCQNDRLNRRFLNTFQKLIIIIKKLNDTSVRAPNVTGLSQDK